jgi:pyruvate dehydrogenase E2 component (dihydrolipoamide acetyltransferase)
MVGRCLQLCVVAIVAGNAFSFAPALGKFFRPQSIVMVATTDVTMPALSSTMTEGKIVAWNKKIGEKVSAGDVLLIVESDKADMDVESYEDGYLAAIYTPEGGSAAVGATVAVLVENVADIASVGAKPPSAVTPAAAIPVAAAPVAAAPVATAVAAAPTLSSDKYDQVMMPALSSTMTEGKVVSWSKKIGEKISSGDMVLIVESDKADMDVESFEDGYLAAILIGDGESAPVGSPVGLMAKTLADLPAVQAYAAALKSGGAPVAAAPAAVVAAPAVAAAVAPAAVQAAGSSAFVPAEGTVNASPQARKLALENNLDVTKIKGTGNFGRVMPDDVLIAAGKKSAVVAAPVVHAPVAATPVTAASAPAAVKAAPGASKETVIMEGVVAMDGMQKAVAKNMEKTLTVPIFRVSRYLASHGLLQESWTLQFKNNRFLILIACLPYYSTCTAGKSPPIISMPCTRS